MSMALDRPDVFRFLLERVYVYHPAKNLGHELSARRVTIGLGSNGSHQTEFCVRSPSFILSVGWRKAHVDMGVPLRDAQRNSLIEFIPVGVLGRGVHHADQLVIVPVLLVEQRS